MKPSLFLFTLSLSLSSTSWGAASQHRVADFGELAGYLQQSGSPSTTLLVMDNDDTLTMMPCRQLPSDCQYLGGPAWYSWQSQLIQHDSPSPMRVAQDSSGLLSISSLLFAMNRMPYTEQDIPGVLNQASLQGIRLLVETARGPSDANATEQQFAALPTAFSRYNNFLSLISQNSLILAADLPAYASPIQPCNIPGSRQVAYQNGIYYVAGQNKGIMLSCLLTKFEQSVPANPGLPITHIVFIDDTLANVEDVYQQFKNDDRYQVTALHYTALQTHKAALTQGPKAAELQRQASQQWQHLKQSLEANLAQPMLP
ncbi:DUF2608 domain-containing protein [Balneatrix alpica]|uniref:DUF2608 domain-containing protein n=1 Tax=Balneatrix alpica TaxID=75684 RepID=UPI00273A5952|nr:DUF2608 domain-containing protein [Balneatrix alpica]